MSPSREPGSSLFLSADRADALAAWCSAEADVISLHLPVDPAGVYPSTLNRLIRDFLDSGPDAKRLAPDLDRISNFVLKDFAPAGRQGLAVYSSIRRGLFESFALPEPVIPRLTAEERPCLRALDLVRGRYLRYLAVLVDARQARVVEIFLGESTELESFPGDFNADNLQVPAARAVDLMNIRRADRLILGAPEELQAPLTSRLPPEVQQRVIHEPLLGPERPIEAVVERVRHNEREALRLRESVLVQRLIAEVREGGAVSGLQAVAAALQQGCVKLLLVRDGWAKMGRACPGCGRLSVDHRSCPWCFRATDSILDLVAELVDRAAAAGIEVFPVHDDPRMLGLGQIAAELAAPSLPPRKEVPASRAFRALARLKGGRPSPLRSRPS